MTRRSTTLSREDHKETRENVMSEEKFDELLTVHEVARRLRVDDTTVRRWIKSGSLEAVTLPHRAKRQAYRVKQSTIDAMLRGGSKLPE
jgi:excisionase family DNA binding protein